VLIASWRLRDYAPGEGVALGAFAESFHGEDWIQVPVPGCVHQALIDAGRIPDPFYDRNELECAWVEEREWWYRSQFALEGEPLQASERLLLVFHGLDTFVTIWLNGQELGRCANMFREAVFDVTDLVRGDHPNTLTICFEPPLHHVRDRQPPSWQGGSLGETRRNLMRKAQFGFGWDWGPRLPTVGIWRPVELLRSRQAAIQGVRIATQEIAPLAERALVTVVVEVEPFAADGPLEVGIALLPPGGAEPVVEQRVPLIESEDEMAVEVSLTVERPRLWWTHDLGEAALYTLDVRLFQEGTELDHARQSVGIRTLELDRSLDPDEPGTRFFRFVLNGVSIFARGANWIPTSSFVGGLTAERYEQMLTAARDGNVNMLRVWGGGIYEHDTFYELCDRLGILIWQDFMFACAPYPEDDPVFVREVQAEVRYQVARLRNHPCLALWCGNNENQWLHPLRAFEPEREVPVPGTLFYDGIMPETVRELDGSTPYWPGSPYGGSHPNSMAEGDVHDWHVWHGHPVEATAGTLPVRPPGSGPTPEDVSFVHYAKNMGRFVSEFGMHAAPVYETLRRCIPSDQLYHHSPSMDHHNKDNPKTKGDNLMLTVTGLPEDLDEYIDYSMIAQAEGLKFGIEHFRRRKPHCSGTLLWQFNDCWPVLSWSIVDYYGFGKAGYYYVRRAYAPVLASFKELDDGAVELWLTNDALQEVDESIALQLGTFAGGMVWEEQLQVRVPGISSQAVWRGGAQQVMAQPDHYLAVRSPSGRFPANRHFFAAVKDLQRSAVEPEVAIASRGEHELRVHLQAPAYVFYLHLIVPHEGTCFSDNYFDLLAGESRTVVVTNHQIPLTPDMVSIRWR
jgi:beta-mannosidase